VLPFHTAQLSVRLKLVNLGFITSYNTCKEGIHHPQLHVATEVENKHVLMLPIMHTLCENPVHGGQYVKWNHNSNSFL